MGARVAIVSDHAAFEMKAMLVDHLRDAGHEVLDLGTASTDSEEMMRELAEALTEIWSRLEMRLAA